MCVAIRALTHTGWAKGLFISYAFTHSSDKRRTPSRIFLCAPHLQCRVVSRPPCSPCCPQSERCKLSVANPSKERNPKAAVSFDPHPERWKLLSQTTAFTLVFLLFLCVLCSYEPFTHLSHLFFVSITSHGREKRDRMALSTNIDIIDVNVYICIIRNSSIWSICMFHPNQTKVEWYVGEGRNIATLHRCTDIKFLLLKKYKMLQTNTFKMMCTYMRFKTIFILL